MFHLKYSLFRNVTILSKIKSHPDANYFKELPFHNKPIEDLLNV